MANMPNDNVSVEVAYALAEEQCIIAVTLPAGSTVRQAIENSGILQRYPQIDADAGNVGILSKLVDLDDIVESGDRVEIYRPLLIDPKETRRKRAGASKS